MFVLAILALGFMVGDLSLQRDLLVGNKVKQLLLAARKGLPEPALPKSPPKKTAGKKEKGYPSLVACQNAFKKEVARFGLSLESPDIKTLWADFEAELEILFNEIGGPVGPDGDRVQAPKPNQSFAQTNYLRKIKTELAKALAEFTRVAADDPDAVRGTNWIAISAPARHRQGW